MAIARKKELAQLSKEELHKRLAQLRLELIKLGGQRATRATGIAKLKELRRTIARIITILKTK